MRPYRVGRYARIGSGDTSISGRAIRPYRVGRYVRIGSGGTHVFYNFKYFK